MAGEKILIIEDNDLNLQLATDLLEFAGYRVIAAKDGAGGILRARQEHPDLILMDLGLPDMDGLSAVGILQEDLSVRDIPVIALTAFAMKGDREKALAAGCRGYIGKPINTREFAGNIESFLRDPKKD